MHSSRSRDALIRVSDAAGNVIETHEHAGRVPRMVRILSTYGVRVSTATLCNRLNERGCRCLSAARVESGRNRMLDQGA